MSDFRSRVLGTIIGTLSRGSFPKREPVAFLYGHVAKEGETPTHSINGVDYVGVVAPKLPDRDKEKYPYCTIFIGLTHEEIDFRASSATVLKSVTTNNLVHTAYSEYRTFYTWEGREQWNEQGVSTAGSNTVYCGADKLLWTNHDIKDKNGVVQITKSADPIPIYE